MNMSEADIAAGNVIPNDFFTVIETPANQSPKYVERDDGPLAVLLICPYAVLPGVMSRTDEAGAYGK